VERIVLDTSVWIDLERGKLDLGEAIGRDKKLILPAIVAGELKQALYALSRTAERMQKSLDFLARVDIGTQNLSNTAKKQESPGVLLIS